MKYKYTDVISYWQGLKIDSKENLIKKRYMNF